MPRYLVSVRRTESIDFEIEAADEDEALSNYWTGEEVFSETVDSTVTSVEEVQA